MQYLHVVTRLYMVCTAASIIELNLQWTLTPFHATKKDFGKIVEVLVNMNSAWPKERTTSNPST